MLTAGLTASLLLQTQPAYQIHDMSRPRPPVVSPAPAPGGLPVPAPPDAIVLFDGTSLDGWRKPDGSPAEWVLGNGYFETGAGTGSIVSDQAFGDVQLHIEFATPSRIEGTGQGRGNSGVYLMSLYEIQILDSYENETYADGQAGAVYGQYPPLVNASRPPGVWQSYDIVFRRPRFARDGSVAEPARITAFHNGLLIHDAVELWGGTDWLQFKPYRVHPDRLPIMLQDHSNPVRFRNIWVRDLEPRTEAAAPGLLPPQLDRYVGQFRLSWGAPVRIVREGGRLQYLIGESVIDLVPKSLTEFHFRNTDARLEFRLDAEGRAVGFTMYIGGEGTEANREG